MFFFSSATFLIFFQGNGENQKEGGVCADHNDPALSGVITNMRNRKLDLINTQIISSLFFFFEQINLYSQRKEVGRTFIQHFSSPALPCLDIYSFRFCIAYLPSRPQASPLPCYCLQMKNTPVSPPPTATRCQPLATHDVKAAMLELEARDSTTGTVAAQSACHVTPSR